MKWTRLAVAAAALTMASPAIASDFSGIGRVFWWGLAAMALLIAIPLVLVRRKGRRGNPETNWILSIGAAVVLAPAIFLHVDGQWVFVPFPGMAVAALEGSMELLFPVPIASMVLCWAGLHWLLTLGDNDSGDEAGE